MKRVTFKRWMAMLLALIVLVGTLSMFACAKPQENGDDENENQPSDSEQDGNTEPVEKLPLDLPEVNYGGAEVHFLEWSVGGDSEAGTSWIPWEEIDIDVWDGDTINGAIYDRNSSIEETYGVEITKEYISVNEGLTSTVRSNASTGDDAFQVLTNRSYEIGTFVLEGLMTNMYELEYLHTDMPWWNQDAVKSFTLGSTLMFAAPELLLRDKGATAAMFYNAKLASDYNIGDLYQMVNDGEWTQEEFITICENVASSMDSNDLIDSADDMWGAAGGDDTSFFMYAGANMKFAVIDNDGYIEYQFGDEESISVMKDIFDYIMYEDFYSNGTETELEAQELFQSDHTLFLFDCVKGVNKLRSMESDYGVLPIPKLDQMQEDYASLVWVHHDSVLGIPDAVQEKEMVSVIVEAMSYISWYDVYPKFYDTVIMGKSTRDEQSKQMLEIIFRTRMFDPGQYWDNGIGESGFQVNILRLPAKGSSDIASVWASYQSAVEDKFDEFNELIAESFD